MDSPVQSSQGIGLKIPERKSDCTGQRPSWHPFVFNVCDDDEPDPVPFTARHLSVPDAP